MSSELFAISEVEKMYAYLLIARDIERYAAEFYYRMGLKLDYEKFEDIALDITMEEVDHIYLIGKISGSLEKEVEYVDVDMAYYEELKHVAMVFPKIDELKEMDILTFFDKAILVEKKSIEYYSTPLKLGVSFEPTRDILKKLVDMEKEHLAKIEAIKNDIMRRKEND